LTKGCRADPSSVQEEGLLFMTSISTAQLSIEALALDFFQQTEGNWHSQRRYYTLKQEGEPQEVISAIQIKFLPRGHETLIQLARLHHLEDTALQGGSAITWESNYIRPHSQKPTIGGTLIGILGNTLYRDRGFATADPVSAGYSLPNPSTLCLRTEYGGSVFEEEIKLIGQQYRTRQTIISRAGEEIMIGQYLEKRVD
jgi:CpeS-like protein